MIDPLTETTPLPPVDPRKYPPLNPNERWMLQKQLEGSHDDETFGAEISYARRLVATIEAVEAQVREECIRVGNRHIANWSEGSAGRIADLEAEVRALREQLQLENNNVRDLIAQRTTLEAQLEVMTTDRNGWGDNSQRLEADLSRLTEALWRWRFAHAFAWFGPGSTAEKFWAMRASGLAEAAREVVRDVLPEYKRIQSWCLARANDVYFHTPIASGPPRNELMFIADKMRKALQRLSALVPPAGTTTND